jgi:glutathione S-transferase
VRIGHTVAMAETPVLITIPISHYCEKARWALDRAGIPFKERAHLQIIHWVPVARAGGRKTAPVLVWGERVFADSAEIVEEASRRAPAGRALFPDDPAAAAEVRALQHDFDQVLGPEGRRWMYFNLRGRRDIAVAYACTGVPAWQRRTLPLAYPLVVRVIDRYLDIDPASAERSEAEVRAAFDKVAERLGDGRPYLRGERFTAADLTFASLAASLLMPREYGVPLPQPDELPAAMAAKVRDFRTHPAGEFAMRMFREERRPLSSVAWS